MHRHSGQTVAYTTHCAHTSLALHRHPFEAAVKTMRRTAIEDKVGAKLPTNGDTCDVLKFFPEALFFAKNVLQEYALGIFANLVTSQGHGIVPCFRW